MKISLGKIGFTRDAILIKSRFAKTRQLQKLYKTLSFKSDRWIHIPITNERIFDQWSRWYVLNKIHPKSKYICSVRWRYGGHEQVLLMLVVLILLCRSPWVQNLRKQDLDLLRFSWGGAAESLKHDLKKMDKIFHPKFNITFNLALPSSNP